MLLDFGSSRELQAHATAPVEEAGTPLYLAPEVLGGESATVQSDLYSLGVLLHYLATARYPVEARTLDDLRRAHAAGAPEASIAAGKPLPRELAAFLSTALARDPARRPRSAAEAAAQLSTARSRRLVWPVMAAAVGISALAAYWSHERPSAGHPPWPSCHNRWPARVDGGAFSHRTRHATDAFCRSPTGRTGRCAR